MSRYQGNSFHIYTFKAIFETLAKMYANYSIVERAGSFRDQDLLTSEQILKIKDTILELCLELRNEILPLIETGDIFIEEFDAPMSYPDYEKRFLAHLYN